MKKLLLNILCALSVLVSAAQSSVDARCHTSERGGCPFKIGDLYVLDRCTGSNPLDPQKTSIGNTLCDAFNNVDIILDNINKGVNKYKSDAEKELKEHLAPLFKDAIDAQALADFNQATKFYIEIFNELKAMVTDKECGLNQMNNLKKFFNDQLGNLNAIKDVVGTSIGVVGKEVPPTMQNLADLTAELANAIKIASGQGQKGAEDLKKVEQALNTLKQQLTNVKNFDVVGMAKSTTDIVVQVGGLYTKCVACATAATATIAEIQKATAEGSVALASPETWEVAGGSAWLLPVAGLDAGVAAAATLVSPAACGAMYEAIENINDDIEALKDYYKRINQVATSVKESITLLEQAADNLAKLIPTVSKELKPSIEKMSQLLSAIDKRIDNVFDGINKKILPKVQAITISITNQVIDNAEHLYNCSQEYLEFTDRVTTETVKGIKDMFTAGTQIVDAAKVMDNMGKGVTAAMNAARSKANTEYNDVKSAFASLENSLCVKRKSNGSIDGPATADCIRDKLFKNGPDAYLNEAKNILDRAKNLAKEIVDLAVKSAEAADDAYTGKPSNTDKATAVAKTKSVRDEANSAKLKILKATKKEFAKNEAKEAAKKKAQAKLAQAKAAKTIEPDPKLSERKPLSPMVVSFKN